MRHSVYLSIKYLFRTSPHEARRPGRSGKSSGDSEGSPDELVQQQPPQRRRPGQRQAGEQANTRQR